MPKEKLGETAPICENCVMDYYKADNRWLFKPTTGFGMCSCCQTGQDEDYIMWIPVEKL